MQAHGHGAGPKITSGMAFAGPNVRLHGSMLGPEMNAGFDAGPIQKMRNVGSVPGPDFGENWTSLVQMLFDLNFKASVEILSAFSISSAHICYYLFVHFYV